MLSQITEKWQLETSLVTVRAVSMELWGQISIWLGLKKRNEKRKTSNKVQTTLSSFAMKFK